MDPTGIEPSTLLVVDDQEINLFIIQTVFGNQHRVLAATNGREALRLSREERPDLILMDVLMPDMDGLEVCRRLKESEETRDIPVIFVTSQGKPDEETRALNAGAVDFISKPINASVVQARVRTHLTLKRQTDFLRSQVFIDGLTGVHNRRRFEEYLAYEWRRCARLQSPVAVFMIDVDNFKRINDTYGHQAGDTVLARLARILRAGLQRSQDLVARYGGEEFVCLVPEMTLVNARGLAERLVDAVAREVFEFNGERLRVTISLGYAVAVPQNLGQPERLVAAADGWLYQAKAQGKNRALGAQLAAEDLAALTEGPAGSQFKAVPSQGES